MNSDIRTVNNSNINESVSTDCNSNFTEIRGFNSPIEIKLKMNVANNLKMLPK